MLRGEGPMDQSRSRYDRKHIRINRKKLTSWRARFRIRENDDAGATVVDQLLQRRRLTRMLLDLAAKALEVDRAPWADFGGAIGRGGSSS